MKLPPMYHTPRGIKEKYIPHGVWYIYRFPHLKVYIQKLSKGGNSHVSRITLDFAGL
ncbi:hypothetical protein [Intestinimonas butyriciproducens]|uniref:hypothetical protein n=1 Tax=Intestinimonas butyriciproducens TaxID=1297617 RepID=UPI001402BF87|nr:hypothetical protein [Intestinimonas butyriciproducens]